jgi:hypothetical protein
LLREGKFEATSSMVILGRKSLLYLKAQVKNSNIIILLDVGAINSFMRSKFAQRLKLEVEQIAMWMKVNFAKWSCEAANLVKGLQFKANGVYFEEDFTMCDLEGVIVVIGNIFLHYFGVEIRSVPLDVLMVGIHKKPKSLSFIHRPILDVLGINMVFTTKYLYKKQFILVLRDVDLNDNINNISFLHKTSKYIFKVIE